MRFVAIRDDDTNALTPDDYLERLYRPFLDRGLPVNLATIPNVRTDTTYGDGIPEGFLVAKGGAEGRAVQIGSNPKLVRYIKENPGYHVVQHGYNHEFINGNCEFEQEDRADVVRRIHKGRILLLEAGLGRPETFVAPYDRFTPASLEEASKHFRVISTSWFDLRKVPGAWWLGYFLKKAFHRPHWRVRNTILLSHPGCHLSYHRPYATMLDEIRRSIESRCLTVLVTHWWEFFRNNQPDEPFIDVLHETAEFLAQSPDIKVVSFHDIARGAVPLN